MDYSEYIGPKSEELVKEEPKTYHVRDEACYSRVLKVNEFHEIVISDMQLRLTFTGIDIDHDLNDTVFAIESATNSDINKIIVSYMAVNFLLNRLSGIENIVEDNCLIIPISLFDTVCSNGKYKIPVDVQIIYSRCPLIFNKVEVVWNEWKLNSNDGIDYVPYNIQQ